MLYNFDVKKVTEECIEWIRNWLDKNGNNCNAVIGISGGKDSSVVAALCSKALGKDRVIGVLMPNGSQNDIEYSYWLCEHLDIKYIVCDIANAFDAIINSMIWGMKNNGTMDNFKISNQTTINLPARIRMSTLYAVSQSCNGRVSCNSNLSERYIGYGTRWADTIGDFAPLSQLTSDEVIAIGEYLGLPEKLTRKTPSDGLCGKTDEDNFGFTYDVLNKYIRTGVCENEEVKNKIDSMHEKNLFKLRMTPCFQTNLPIEIF